MNGDDLCELAKILGQSNIKTTEVFCNNVVAWDVIEPPTPAFSGLASPDSAEGQIRDLIPPLFRLRCRPDKKQRLDDPADGALLLGKDKNTWGWLSAIKAISKVPRHCVPVVGDQNAILLNSEFEEL